MKTITAITPQKKSPDRCNIFLDGEFFCGMSLIVVMKNRLKAGMKIDVSRIEEIQLETEKNEALDKAMTLLSSYEKTEKQVRDYLKEKGYTPLVISYVTDKLGEYGFVSDESYAMRYADAYAKKKGAKLIALELKRKGVSEETAVSATENLGDQTEFAVAIAEKYVKNKPLDIKTKQKLYRHLLSKGFSYDEVQSATDRMFGYSDDEND